MFKKVNFFATLVTSLAGGVLFSVPVFFFIRDNAYTESWLLYLGSFLFLTVIWIHTVRENKKRREDESTVALIFISHVATIAGIIISCIICFLLLVTMVPGYLDSGMADKVLTGEPANTIKDKTDGLSFDIFFAATVINFAVGSFAGIILPFYTKRTQTKDSKEPTPLHQYGVK